MTLEPVELNELITVRPATMTALQVNFAEREHFFWISLKQGYPNWRLFDHQNAAELPAIRWKL